MNLLTRPKRFLIRHRKPLLGAFIALLILYWNCLPRQLFDEPVCTVIEDRNGNLLSATIASDGQWRFPPSDSVPEKFEKALLTFEDKRFYRHAGVDPLAMGRALVKNLRSGSIVSGGSTITMQVMRLSRQGKSRNIWQKLTEMVLATRLELATSKKEILALYCSNAPFGGNVVGLDAASWRYFGKSADKLSWAEAACLAVLPNSPSLVTPGKNRQLLRSKRDDLLTRMHERGYFDSTTLELSLSEPLPYEPLPLPQMAMHLLNRAALEGKTENGILRTTLDVNLQQRVNDIIERHHQQLSQNGIHNAAAIVVDVESGEVLAYVGNTSGDQSEEEGYDVDVITSPRSTGSILKPFLYAAMLNDGALLPNALVPDVPTKYGSFTPTNFSQDYDGAVPASNALARSLNVPAVRMLLDYGLDKFYQRLKQFGMTTLTQPPSHYGLSLILGGAEASLWDIVGMYASMARTLNHYSEWSDQYSSVDWSEPNFQRLPPTPKGETIAGRSLPGGSPFRELEGSDGGRMGTNPLNHQITKSPNPYALSASSIYQTFNAMVEVNRPDEDASWRLFGSSQRIAWKTGTSYGHRDAWAVGVTPKYVVGVWCGNADGEGRPGLVGVEAAAPILFEIFSGLDAVPWFRKPFDDMIKVPVCNASGYRASPDCPQWTEQYVPKAGKFSPACPYHHVVHLDKDRQYQVTSACIDVDDMAHESWFVLPPAIELYYAKRHPGYKPLPPLKPECEVTGTSLPSMELIYPKLESRIYVPLDLDGTPRKTVFEAAHRRPNTRIYWSIDNEHIGVTQGTHQMALRPTAGKHVLVLTDENGERLTQTFEVLERRK